MLPQSTNESLRPVKILTFQDGPAEENKQVTIRMEKYPAEFGEKYFYRFVAMLVKAGIPLPKKMSQKDVAEALGEDPVGMLIQLRDLDMLEVDSFLNDMFRSCSIVAQLPDGGERQVPMTQNNINAHIQEPFTLVQIREEVLRFNYSFFFTAVKSRLMSSASLLSSLSTQTLAQ